MADQQYDIDTSDRPQVRLKTQRIGLFVLDAQAPVVGGRLRTGPTGSGLRLEMALDQLRSSNPLLQAAARALVSRGNGESLVFDATCPQLDEPWSFAGDAQAGDVIVPMEVEARWSDGDALDLSGSATLQDIHIPLPGLSQLKQISFRVAALLPVVPPVAPPPA